MPSNDDIALFIAIGLPETRAKETAKNAKLSNTLRAIVHAAGVDHTGCDRTFGVLFYDLASKAKKHTPEQLEFIAREIKNGNLKTGEQVSAALTYVGEHPLVANVEFKLACGVGVVVSDEAISRVVLDTIEAHFADIEAKGTKVSGQLLGKVKQHAELRWAPTLRVKEMFDEKFALALSSITTPAQVTMAKDKKEAPKAKTNEPAVDYLSNSIFFEGELSRLHKPGGNPQIRPELMEAHLKATGGTVVTRFPPEPNGYLHIGHAKAINVNFGYAAAHNGICYLRYDDTNPEAEEEEYFVAIREAVEWLGFKPYKITYSSDYFQQLFDLAVKLTKKGLAYACSCTPEEIHAQRGGDEKGPRFACQHRERPIDESLHEFEKMKHGEYKEGEMTLRMKMDLDNPSPLFWDLVAYRILDTPHHRTGSQWKIYPTYDFTHCLVDSMENITHSLCTTEFRMARESYYWLCDAVEVYKPVQWEYGRLNITNTVLSKRKLLKLINGGHVAGWDDPRLYTISAVRRRGVPPEAINAFVREVGVTTANTTTDVARLDFHVRNYLNEHAPRLAVVLEPIRVKITNLPEGYEEMVALPNHPKKPEMGSHQVPFTNVVYIERSDFRMADEPGYYRLAPGKLVGLLNVKHPIRCIDFDTNADGLVTEVRCEYVENPTSKPKTYIHWVAESVSMQSPVKIDEIRVYGNLFKHANPFDKDLVPDGWLSDVDTNSLTVYKDAIAEVGIKAYTDKPVEHPENVRFQFLRTGFFAVDKDTKFGEGGRLVINRIVSLKEDAHKN